MDAGLLIAVWGCGRARADALAPHMGRAQQMAGITTPRRLAHWLAQVGHESGRGRYLREIWGPTAQQARYEPGSTLAARLGNTQPGDGVRYMGRGLIQVTGRANHRALTRRLRGILPDCPDFEGAPRLLETPEWAALSAADYWLSRGLNRLADADDMLMLTRRINGGTNGLADRQALYAKASAVIGGRLE